MPLIRIALVLGQGPNPYGGGQAVVLMTLLVIVLCVAALMMSRLQLTFPRSNTAPRQFQPLKRIAGFLVGCLLVGTTAVLIDMVTTELEFSERVDVSEDGRVIGSGTERSEGWYRLGRAIYVLSMLGFLACGVMIGVRMQRPFLRNGVSWGMVIAAVWALFAG